MTKYLLYLALVVSDPAPLTSCLLLLQYKPSLTSRCLVSCIPADPSKQMVATNRKIKILKQWHAHIHTLFFFHVFSPKRPAGYNKCLKAFCFQQNLLRGCIDVQACKALPGCSSQRLVSQQTSSDSPSIRPRLSIAPQTFGCLALDAPFKFLQDCSGRVCCENILIRDRLLRRKRICQQVVFHRGGSKKKVVQTGGPI